jgi:hypothetical protein
VHAVALALFRPDGSAALDGKVFGALKAVYREIDRGDLAGWSSAFRPLASVDRLTPLDRLAPLDSGLPASDASSMRLAGRPGPRIPPAPRLPEGIGRYKEMGEWAESRFQGG